MEQDGGKFLSFLLEDEEYGISIHRVKEIIGIMDITAIPKTPEFIRGVINLRGKIIPVLDLRLKFGMKEMEYNQRTCIIVVEVSLAGTSRLMGIIVDTVSEVVNIQKGEIEPPPQYDSRAEEGFLTGIGKVKEKVILLLEIEKVLGNEDLVILNEKQEAIQNV
ncbi:chemotaxis protein CheW [Herbivorax sp. ANBcel31]|uniref:chemotaxis protein CheW n=1 Tax=Herbivorax sp. ANBcel31 TaxID=3069754 RepID=UPI0027AE00AF|nr:chemotaxis protein CheW [Herbivorax sp. ANBcel31]MDQ2084912.1 chemotaxis protein CheW [Herbivorax sp. ANBcel31]